jgi:hypothetical protein
VYTVNVKLLIPQGRKGNNMFGIFGALKKRSWPRKIDWRESAQESETLLPRRRRPGVRHVCGCHLTRLKNGRAALRCPVAGTKKGMVKFIKQSRVAAYRGRKNICTDIAVPFGTPGAARRGRGRPFSFKTSKGKLVSFRRKPSFKTAKRMTSYYYNQLRKRLTRRGLKPRYMPSFAGWSR